MDIKIIEPIKHYIKEFNSPEEFNLWYSKNKDEIDSETTHMLNKKYHINGYRITKIKGILMLKSDVPTKEKQDNISEIDNLKSEIENLREALNQLITFVKEKLPQ